ncbi:GNAT family N-acetyltransferase [Clostridium gasigenes]|uniref:GNAT family N-acetyltransferase n=1 Tax=Clostridium gasigenes TaxID=94869 RepID=UPI001C0B1D56|nr:GNAT family N-acetyltransferase [Clostridium gasigenes]MBU3102572.1 GNAT family N-acetyltransferase [Clostridium gasigenes]
MEFKDRKGRMIYLEESYGIIYAYLIEGNGRCDVGSIQFSISEYLDKNGEDVIIAYPEQIHIDESYQRSGIATQIIEYAKEIYDVVKFSQDSGCGGNTDEIHYSGEGLAFKNFCEMTGITENNVDYEED